jgi:hypothetical protein
MPSLLSPTWKQAPIKYNAINGMDIKNNELLGKGKRITLRKWHSSGVWFIESIEIQPRF